MTAEDNFTEDFIIDKETIYDSEISLKFNEYSSEEISTKEFNLNELDYIDKNLTDSPFLDDAELLDFKFIHENNIEKVVSLSNDKYCENCGENTRRKSFWTNTNFYVNK